MAKTLYLDTANWNDLAEGTVDGAPLMRAVERGEYVPVFSYVHLAEFARKEEPYRSRVVALAEKFRVAGTLRWIRSAKQLQQLEAERAFRAWIGWPVGAICPFGHSMLEVAEHVLSPHDRAAHAHATVASYVDLIRANPAWGSLQAMRDQSPVVRRLIRERRGKRQRFSLDEKKGWICARIRRGQVFHETGRLSVVVSDGDLDQFRRELDLRLCPAVNAIQAFHEGWNISVDGEEPSDLDDEIHVAGVVYCDKAFADKRTCDALRKGGWPAERMPMRNREFAKWVAGLAASYEEG